MKKKMFLIFVFVLLCSAFSVSALIGLRQIKIINILNIM